MTRPGTGAPTDAWAFLLPPGWARFPVGERSGDTRTGAVYRPTEPVAGMVVPASIIEVELFGAVGLGPGDVATRVARGPFAVGRSVDLDGRPGARMVRNVHDVHREGGRPARSTREVTYVVSRDEAAGDWLVLTFGTSWDSPGTERLAETLVEFFDAVMATFRWTGPGSGTLNLPERNVPGSA